MKALIVSTCCPFDGADLDPMRVDDPEGDLSTMTARCTSCGSTFQVTAVLTCPTPRFDYQSLERYIVRSLEVPAHEGPGCRYCDKSGGSGGGGTSSCASAPMIARMCGVKEDTVQSWKRRGMNDRKADRVATALGTHPASIWPAQWAALCAADHHEMEDA